MTHVAQVALQREALAARPSEASESWAARAITRLGQWLCGLQGHETLLHFEQHRVALRCVACGYHTPGWTTEGLPRPQLRYSGDRARHRLVRDVNGRRH